MDEIIGQPGGLTGEPAASPAQGEAELQPGEDLIAFGVRMKEIRKRANISIREAAARAGIDKNTVQRLEVGLPVRRLSRESICRVYGVLSFAPSLQSLASEGGEDYRVFRNDEGTWFRMKLHDEHEPSEISTNDEMQLAAERLRQGRLGFANQFFRRIACDLPGGKLKAAVLEVYGRSGYAAQTSGEAFVQCVKGSVFFEVGEERFILRQGDSACFDRTRLHMHAPTDEVAKADLPCLLLYVQVD